MNFQRRNDPSQVLICRVTQSSKKRWNMSSKLLSAGGNVVTPLFSSKAKCILFYIKDKHAPGGQRKKWTNKINMLFNWHGWPVGLILPEGGLVKESFSSNKLKGCWVPHMTSIVEVRMDLFIEKKHLSLSLAMCECESVMWRRTINLQYGNTYLYNLLTTQIKSKINQL